jgi:hypothetical protein
VVRAAHEPEVRNRRSPSPPARVACPGGPGARVLALQAQVGNRAVGQLLTGTTAPLLAHRPTVVVTAAVQRCGDVPGSECPCSEDGDHAQAPLQPVQRQVATGITVQRTDYSSPTVRTLLAETAMADVPGKIIGDQGDWLAKATPDERVRLINACVDTGGDTGATALDQIWFRTANWEGFARANPAAWTRSLSLMKTQWLKGPFFKNLLDAFLFDTEEVARGYLEMNETYCTSSLEAIFYDLEGRPRTGPPTDAQQKARDTLVDNEAAQDAVALQEKLKSTRTLEIGLVPTGEPHYLPDGRLTGVRKPLRFNPDEKEKPADLMPMMGDPPGRRWETVRAGYDEGVTALRKLLSRNPNLYLLIRDKVEDAGRTTQASTDTTPGKSTIRDLVAAELAGTLKNIGRVKPMLSKPLAAEFTPIHEQLRTGGVTSPKKAGRNWNSDPVWKAAADAYTDANKPPPWYVSLGLATAEAGLWIFVGISTGGVGFAAAMAVKGGLEAAMAAGKSGIMAAASQASTTPDSQLVTADQADAAKTDAMVATAFAVLDALMVGTEIRSAAQAGKLAALPGAKAAQVITMSESVLRMERKLLGKISASEAETEAKSAARLAADARKLANEAKTAGDASAARMADKAAKRAEDAAKRVEQLAVTARRSEDAAKGVAETAIVKHFEVPLPGGHKIVVSKSGQVFRCSTPCMDIKALYAPLVERNPTLKARAAAVEAVEKEAMDALPNLKEPSRKAVQARLGQLSATFAHECMRYEKAEAVAEWLAGQASRYPGLAGKNLDASAILRIVDKGPRPAGLKGQLLEELGGASIEEMLKTTGGRSRLAGEFAAKDLKYYPGSRLRDGTGRQLTDGIVGYWEGDTFHIVTIVESKAGLWAAEGLRMGNAELSAVHSARFKLMRAAAARGDTAGLDAIRDMDPQTFMKTHKAAFDEARVRVESFGDWPRVALEDTQMRWIDQLKGEGKPDLAESIRKMGTSEFAARFPQKLEESRKLLPLPEGGQLSKDIERFGSFGGKVVENSPPKIVKDGKLSPAWSGKDVPADASSPTKFAGSRGTVRGRAFAPSDVDAAQLGSQITENEGIQTGVSSVGQSAAQLEALAIEIGAQGKTIPKP